MITKTAWKNVWRNKVRSLVVIGSVTVGIFAGSFAVAVMEGAIYQRIEEALDNEISHIQVTQPGFRDNNELGYLMENGGEIKQDLLNIPGVQAVTGRLVVMGMANTATKSAGVVINGIDVNDETSVFGLNKKIKEGTGTFLKEGDPPNRAVIGVDLAKSLNIIRYTINERVIDTLQYSGAPEQLTKKLAQYTGTRFKNEKSFKKEMKTVLTPTEEMKWGYLLREASMNYRRGARFTLTFIDKDGYQTGGRFRISGLYDVPNMMFESGQVFVSKSDLERLSGITPDSFHQLIVKLDDVDATDEITASIKSIYPDLEVMNWKEIQPDLAMMSTMAGAMYAVFMGIILAALAFGIVNTMLMVVLERTKELGMLAAIGMNRKKIFRMIMSESVFLSLTGGIVGMIVSKIIISATTVRGINFSGYQEGLEAMGYSAHIYPYISNEFFVIVTIMIIVTGILSSVYPAIKALRLDPADALRTE